MPYLNEIKAHLIKNVSQNVRILDAGDKYSNLLKDNFPNIDGIFTGNVLDFDVSTYDYIILSDIENITYEDAKSFLDKLQNDDKLCLVGVMYNFEQDETLQPNLTEALFLERYPNMSLLMGNYEYGYFVNYEFEL
jgi:hypothetical protein